MRVSSPLNKTEETHQNKEHQNLTFNICSSGEGGWPHYKMGLRLALVLFLWRKKTITFGGNCAREKCRQKCQRCFINAHQVSDQTPVSFNNPILSNPPHAPPPTPYLLWTHIFLCTSWYKSFIFRLHFLVWQTPKNSNKDLKNPQKSGTSKRNFNFSEHFKKSWKTIFADSCMILHEYT